MICARDNYHVVNARYVFGDFRAIANKGYHSGHPYEQGPTTPSPTPDYKTIIHRLYYSNTLGVSRYSDRGVTNPSP